MRRCRGRLLVGIGTGQQACLAPLAPHEDQAERRPGRIIAGRHRHARQSGDIDFADRGFMDRAPAVQGRQSVPHLRKHQRVQVLAVEDGIEDFEISFLDGDEG